MASHHGIARQRLASQRLLAPGASSARDVVSRLGAVQSQDYSAAKWAIGLRSARLTDADVERACDRGVIVRTHVLRPTWHFVVAADLRWMLALSAPRVIAGSAGRWRALELDAAQFRRSSAALTKALRDGRELTRPEAAVVLARAGIATARTQRLSHLLMRAEMDGVVCSGRRRGNLPTYALLEERVPPTRAWDRDEALRELALRYFPSHGPATALDFVWWSGLTVGDARRAIAAAGTALEQRTIDGTPYWLGAGAESPARSKVPAALLLPNYDEYFIGFRDRSAILTVVRRSDPAKLLTLMAHVVVIDGQVAGGWKRTLEGDRVFVTPTLLMRPTPSKRRAVSAAVERYGRFLELPAAVV